MSLAVESLHYGYRGRSILADVSLQLTRGEVVSLLGVNGAGKSTLLKCVSGFLRPNRGEILLDGSQLRRLSRNELARRIAYVPQQSGAAAALRVFDIVGLGRAPHREVSSPRRDREVVLRSLARLELEALALRPFNELSGGERRRVLLARALAQETPILLLDEPTSDLDLRHQLETMSLVRRLADEDGLCALVAIHDLSLAARFSDRLVLMRDGGVDADGPPERVLTAANLERVYDVGVVTGAFQGLPVVMPVARREA